MNATPLYLYRVVYYSMAAPGLIRRMKVIARDAKAARATASLIDPLFLSTVESPRRLREYRHV